MPTAKYIPLVALVACALGAWLGYVALAQTKTSNDPVVVPVVVSHIDRRLPGPGQRSRSLSPARRLRARCPRRYIDCSLRWRYWTSWAIWRLKFWYISVLLRRRLLVPPRCRSEVGAHIGRVT